MQEKIELTMKEASCAFAALATTLIIGGVPKRDIGPAKSAAHKIGAAFGKSAAEIESKLQQLSF